MFPSNGPFLRHVLVSTGKRDWPHDIASVKGTLAELYSKWAEEEPKTLARNSAMNGNGNGNGSEAEAEAGPTLPAGCWRTSPGAPDRPSRLLIGNSSQVSTSHHSHGQSVMLLPDYEVLCDVQDATGSTASSSSAAETAARNAYEAYVSPSASSNSSSSSATSNSPTALRAARKDGVRRYVLPYKAIVVLCSHKKRDARCGISAPLLADVFRRHAEAAGWEVDERGDDVGHHHSSSASREDDDESSLQWSEEGIVTNRGWGYVHDSPSPTGLTPDEQSRLWRKTLHVSSPSSPIASGSNLPSPPAPTLGIFHTSHIGKHKYAGNVMVYLPNRAGVWYGRVDPLGGGAGQVWEQTILQGRVIPEFLRLGMNLWRGGNGGREEDPTEVVTEQERVSGSTGEIKAAAGEQPGILRW